MDGLKKYLFKRVKRQNTPKLSASKAVPGSSEGVNEDNGQRIISLAPRYERNSSVSSFVNDCAKEFKSCEIANPSPEDAHMARLIYERFYRNSFAPHVAGIYQSPTTSECKIPFVCLGGCDNSVVNAIVNTTTIWRIQTLSGSYIQIDGDERVLPDSDFITSFFNGEYATGPVVDALINYYFESYMPKNISVCSSWLLNSSLVGNIENTGSEFRNVIRNCEELFSKDILLVSLYDSRLPHYVTLAIFSPKEVLRRLSSDEDFILPTSFSRLGLIIVFDSLNQSKPEIEVRLQSLLARFFL